MKRASVPKVQLSSGAAPVWYFRYRMPRQANANRVVIGAGSLSKREAEKRRDAKIVEFRGLPSGFDADMTFAQFVEKVYTPEHLDPTKIRTSTINLYQQIISDHILPYFGWMKLAEVKLIHVNTWCTRMIKRGHAYNTVHMERSVLQSIFSRAERHELIAKNPTKFSEIPGEKKAKLTKRAFSPEEVAAIVKAHPGISLLIRLGVSTGMRVSELLGLRWANVNLIDGWLTVKERLYKGTFDHPKNEAALDKEHPLGSLLTEMRERRAAHPEDVFVFQRPGRTAPTTYAMVNQRLRNVLDQLGMWTPGCSYHALRRAYITYMLPNASSLEVAHMVGKASVEALKDYVQVPKDRHSDLVAAHQKKFFGESSDCVTDVSKTPRSS